MDSMDELSNLVCQIKEHSNAKIIGFCIQENCLSKNKFACQECFFDVHSGHKMVKAEALFNIIQNKLKEYKHSLEEEKKSGLIYSKYENNLISNLDKIKENIISEINIKINQYEEFIKKKFASVNNNKKININIKKYDEFFNGNAAPIQKPDLIELSKICTNIYKEKNTSTSKETSIQIERRNSKIYEEINKSVDEFIKNQHNAILAYIKQNFLIPKYNFEWCQKTYGGYDFFYTLSKNNTKAIKYTSQGTMTVLRAKEPLLDNFLYKLRFKIGLKNPGDYDIGIGTNKTGDSCWLRTKESICLSNTGVMNMDINMDNSIKLKDNDVINLEINTKVGSKYFKGFINNVLVCLIDYDFDAKEVFVMAAMRNVGSFIELEEYDISPLDN